MERHFVVSLSVPLLSCAGARLLKSTPSIPRRLEQQTSTDSDSDRDGTADLRPRKPMAPATSGLLVPYLYRVS